MDFYYRKAIQWCLWNDCRQIISMTYYKSHIHKLVWDVSTKYIEVWKTLVHSELLMTRICLQREKMILLPLVSRGLFCSKQPVYLLFGWKPRGLFVYSTKNYWHLLGTKDTQINKILIQRISQLHYPLSILLEERK